jgi:peptide/nickel transport system permease protein
MNFLFYAGKRVLQVIPALFGISIVVFVLVHLIPGDPADVILGQTATPARSAVVHHLLGIDRPLIVQYFSFLGHLFQGSFGTSFFNQVSVSHLILGRLSATAFLMVGGILISLLISVPLAILAASKEGAARDQAVRVIPIIGLGMPQVWVGIELILLLGLKVRLFPVSGFGDSFLQHARSTFLPALTIAIGLSPILIRSLRASMLEILEADFVLTAKAKGIGKARVTLSHVVRNAIIASVTVLGVNIAYLVGSTVVVERVFAIPATGSLMIDAISNRDYPIVQGVTIFFALVVVTVNLLADLIHAALDPRVAL